MAGPTSSTSTTATEAAKPYIRRLERLVDTLLTVRGTGLATFQKDLLAVQRDLRRAIAEAKASHTPDARAVLHGLRSARAEARRLGDAFAWLLLGNDRRLIYTLADNPQPVPIPPDDDAWRGFVEVADYFASRGMGYPLLHDITDTLRIGDVSFVHPGEPPVTVEFKTSIVHAEKTPTGRTLQYEVLAVLAAEDPPERVVNAMKAPGPPSNDQQKRKRRQLRHKPEFDRQLRRLRKSEMLRAAGDGEITTHGDGPPSLTVIGPAFSGASHWPVLRRLAREARRSGYASAAVEESILYVAIHRADGYDGADMTEVLGQVPADLDESGIFWAEPPPGLWNHAAMFSIPEDSTKREPQLYMPYFLYPIQRWAVRDILRSRLGFLAILNIGRLAAAVKAKGLDVELHRGELVVFKSTVLASGATARLGVGGLGRHLVEMVQEALPIDYYATIAERMAEAISEQYPTIADKSA